MTLLDHAKALYNVAKNRHCACTKRLNRKDEWVILQQCHACKIIEAFEQSGFCGLTVVVPLALDESSMGRASE